MKTILILLLLILILGCSKKGRFVPQEESSQFERVWLNPKVVSADSLFTLISSAEIDSVPHDPLYSTPPSGPGLDFEIQQPSCMVEISLLGDMGTPPRGLILQLLPKGYYRVTVTPLLLRKEQIQRQATLEARICGRSIRQDFPIRSSD